MTARLTGLVRKEFVRPDKAQLPGEDGFRFRHLLIRDAAYDALPKASRADLHESFAAWLEQQGRDLVELDEVLGHHLEQASRYKAGLGQPHDALARRAGERLAAAGRRAQARGDMPAVVRFLRRSASLLPDEAPERPELLLALGIALSQTGDLSGADTVLGEAVAAAVGAGDRRLEHHARIERLARRTWSGSGGSAEEQHQAIERAIVVFEAEGDDLGLARVYKSQAVVYNDQNRPDERAQALKAALQHARTAGDPVEENEIVSYLAGALTFILRPAEARLTASSGNIALLESDPAAAEREFRRGCELFEAMGERSRRATTMFSLAEAVYEQGRLDEAEQLAAAAEELSQEELPSVRAKVLASRGELAEAEALARRSVELARGYLGMFVGWLLDAAEVFRLAGLEHEARSTTEEALAVYERTGNLVMAERARQRLASATKADATDLA